ncbi:glycogen branching protein [Candidatus Francisella endociliophora]|uniref:1,4-alpha-glucan branching enzyme GlgB n=1 Tax=Candidatus Francisella endociliophora TaxID=653937 RepID=A0A097ENR4_9GAMM|nr:1,4-alpha-glucan branching protein GlgB [Francisella sp. FSC1006]AIT09205.1 glycogen branching protein [Francisella sp. FSC1006]
MSNSNSNIQDLDRYYFHEGKHIYAYNFMGAHQAKENNVNGIRFTTWAPNAKSVCVIGDFCHWEIKDEHYMFDISGAGLWSVFIPNVKSGDKYKFVVTNKDTNHYVYKSDPYAFKSELRPNTASVVNTKTEYKWHDEKWLKKRAKINHYETPMNTYELHLASWKTKDGEFMTYEEIAETLPEYVKEMGYTHVEFMPLHEHPLDASWGYQPTGFYSINSRHGDPVGLKHLIDKLHTHDIGVILDWVPGHFCKDEHGLINFDGSACYEYQEPTKADNKGWGTYNFDLGRNEVKCFLISNAMYWINEYHVDGLRVDAVSNILYLNYDRDEGQWKPNIHGGHENLEGIAFLKELNGVLKHTCKGVITIAEESSAWPDITTPAQDGGLGFDFKWNMGWMNDTLRYIALDPVYRKYHHHLITFSMTYHYSEKFILSISHDEVVHGKKPLVDKMWGDLWNKYAGLRLYLTYMIGHPGKKLIFMGSEFGQFIEWREFEQLQWQIIDEYQPHRETLSFFKKLNEFYKKETALWECDYDHSGFQWIDANNSEQSILSFVRNSKDNKESLVFVCNFTPVTYYDYHLGVPKAGSYTEVFNSDKLEFGGSGQIMSDEIFTANESTHGFDQRITIKIPPMAAIVLKLKQ